MAHLLQMPKEGEDSLERQVVKRQLRDVAMRIVSDEAQEQFQAIPVAAYRRRPEPLHRDKTVQEERLDDRPDGRRRHGDTSLSTGAAKPSNRRFAAESNSAVMVR